MREAEFNLEVELINYCKDILLAKDEEELETIKVEMANYLKAYGLNEATIANFFTMADQMVENESVVVEEDGDLLINNHYYGTLNTETNTLLKTEKNQNYNNNTMTGTLITGIGLTAIVSVLALKSKVLNKKKQNEENRSR